ncbi:MAG TPA: ATP-binding protein, partial [Verrucomicrobiae bacterium]|nr:ATP-binding protein [Verrucomicrobiae bacterium]
PRFSERRQDLAEDKSYEWEVQRVTLPSGRHGVVCYFSDITERVRAEQALRNSEERTRLATEATGVGVWEWNVKTGSLRWDAHIFRTYGIAPTPGGMVTYETWRDRVLPEDLPEQEKLLQEMIRSGNGHPRNFRIQRPGEKGCRHIQAVETVRRNARGEVEWVVGTNLDITERHHAEMALHEAKAAAESANRAKDQFLAALSHELRTPLMPVLITAETLREDTSLPLAVREQLSMVERNISLEVQLLGDLLDINAAAHGKLRIRSELFDAHKLIGLAVEIVQDEAAAKGIHIERDLAARHGGLTADAARFQQVIWNLLRNAVKFTPPAGQIKIRTLETHSPGGQLQLRVEVSDSGMGIEPAFLQKIFEPFEQASVPGRQQFGGLGLGLAIARAIVDLHGGRIWAESAGTNRGSTFVVEFPGASMTPQSISDQPQTSCSDEVANPRGPGLETGRRLLLVDDHEPTLQVMTSLLTRSGYQLVTASTVAEALAAAARGTFDLVISDLGLPDGTGIQLMEKLRDQYGLRGIALSGYGMEEDIARARRAGFVAHLIKPVRMADLRKALTLP